MADQEMFTKIISTKASKFSITTLINYKFTNLTV